jgi:hypothetical protein
MAILKGPVNPVVSGITTFPELDNIQVATPNRHSVKPSLVLDFANSKTLDPRITFTRGSNATYYDGTTALAEQNLIPLSQEFTNTAVWSFQNATMTANAGTAPDGTNTAYKINENTVNSSHGVEGNLLIPPATTDYTISVYVKAAERTWFILDNTHQGVLNYRNWFNLSNGTVGTVAAGNTATITSVGNGWYRCAVSRPAGTGGIHRPNFYTATADNTVSFAGTSGSGVLIWGAQLEQRLVATTYTPTLTTSSITNYIPVLKTAGPNQPRFDVDPITMESKGLMVEESRTNLYSYSSEFNNAYWTLDAGGTLVTNNAVAPDGTLTADFIRESTSGGITPRLIKTAPNSDLSATTFTYSIYVKPVGAKRNIFMLCQDSSNAFYAHFDVVAGTVVQTAPNGSGTLSSSNIQSVGNGWFRISITGSITSASIFSMIHLEAVTGTGFGAAGYTGNGFSGMLVWGAQLETGALPTSYIATTTASATRVADLATMTGTNFSSWFNNNQGTFYAEGRINNGGRYYHVYRSGTNHQIEGVQNTNRFDTFVYNSATQADIQISAASNVSHKVASAYRIDDFVGCVDGGTVSVDTSGVIPPALDTLNINAYTNSGVLASGNIKKIAYYPVRLTNAELQGMTAA